MENKDLENWIMRVETRVRALEANKLTEKPVDYSLVIQSIRNQSEQLEKRADNHGARISVLESAKIEQRKLNAELLKKPEVKTFNWFRKF